MFPKDLDGIANNVDLIRLLFWEQSDLGLHCLFRPNCANTENFTICWK